MSKTEVSTSEVKDVDSQSGSLDANDATSREELRPPRVYKRARKEKSSAGKDRVSKIPPCPPGKRSSIYRGVTRHRWTGRYEAHLWDKSTWNTTQKKKGKQVYLGAYDEEQSAARAYDLAALKYWGPSTLTNFPVTDYTKDIEEMQNVSREEYLASLRRKSSGFSRGVSKYRGVARHHHNGRWEARIGRVFGNKYLYLGTYSTQEEAAAAYDMAAIEYRGLNAVTNFDLSRYIRWLRPGNMGASNMGSNDQLNASLQPSKHQDSTPLGFENFSADSMSSQTQKWGYDSSFLRYSPSTPSDLTSQNHDGFGNMVNANSTSMHQSMPFLQPKSSSSPTALSLLLQSNMFRQMLEKTTSATHHRSPSTATMDSSSLPQFQLDDDENDVEINYKDLFPNSTHIELSDYSSKEAEADMNDYNMDYQEAGDNDTLSRHQHISNMFSSELQITTDIYASPNSSCVFDSYTQQSPRYAPNLNDIIVDEQEDQGQMLDQADAAALNRWDNDFRVNSVSVAMPQTSTSLTRCCRSNY